MNSGKLLLLLLIVTYAVRGYDADESLKAVYYSAVSYCLITDIMDWNCGRPCE